MAAHHSSLSLKGKARDDVVGKINLISLYVSCLQCVYTPIQY